MKTGAKRIFVVVQMVCFVTVGALSALADDGVSNVAATGAGQFTYGLWEAAGGLRNCGDNICDREGGESYYYCPVDCTPTIEEQYLVDTVNGLITSIDPSAAPFLPAEPSLPPPLLPRTTSNNCICNCGAGGGIPEVLLSTSNGSLDFLVGTDSSCAELNGTQCVGYVGEFDNQLLGRYANCASVVK